MTAPLDPSAPDCPEPSRSAVWGAAALASLLALTLGLARRAPGVTFEDSGLLAAAASSFGIPHPPGYPLWTMLAGIAVRAGAPFGLEPAASTNLLSTVCAAAACGLLAAFATRRGAGWILGAGLGLTLLVSRTFRHQALVTEVYALATGCQLAFCALALGSRRRPRFTGLALGLALCAHLASALLAPLALRALRGPRDLLRLLGGLALGLAPFLYVPLRSLADPAIDWGDPETPQRLLAHLTRAQYAGNFEPDRSGAVRFLVDQGPVQLLGPLALGVALGAACLGSPAVRARALWLALTTAVVSVGLLSKAVYPDMVETVRWRLAGSTQVLVVALAMALSLGVAAFASRRRSPRTVAALLLGLAAAASATPAPKTLLPDDLSGARTADAFARGVFEQAPPEAVVWINRLGSTDVLGFPLLYRQVALRERPDLVLVDRAALEMPWYRSALGERAPDLVPALNELGGLLSTAVDPASRRRATGIVFLAARAGNRPLVATDPPGPAILQGRPLSPAGLLWWNEPPKEAELLPVRIPMDGEPDSPWRDLLEELAIGRRRSGLGG